MDLPSTSISLIRRAKERDNVAWQRINEIYGPLVYRRCRNRGLSPHDSADVLQDVFQSVSQSIGQYRRLGDQASFRRWLYGITRHKINDFFRRNAKQQEIELGSGLEATMPAIDITIDEANHPTSLDENDRRLIAQRTLAAIQGEYSKTHWKAFHRTVIDSQPATVVAVELQIKPALVRQIKSRILRRLRQELRELGELH